MPVTVYDIAREAGVSRATVQRALLNKGRISPETKARIKKIAAELRYRPNHVALMLTLGKSNLIGAVTFPTTFTAAQLLHEPISRGLRQRGYQMLFSTASGTVEDERLCLEQLFNNRVLGAIMIGGPSEVHKPLLEELLENNVKILLIDAVMESLPVPQFVADQYQAARILVEHLVGYGHRKIAYLAIPGESYNARERRRGFFDAMADAGIPVPPSYVIDVGFSEEAGAKATYELLRLPDPPTAILARHDVVAMGAMDVILGAGLSIPGDISLAGAAGMWFAHALRVPLTTVQFSPSRDAEFAVKTMLDMLDGHEVKTGIQTTEGILLERASCGPPNPQGLREHIRLSDISNKSFSDLTLARYMDVPQLSQHP